MDGVIAHLLERVHHYVSERCSEIDSKIHLNLVLMSYVGIVV